MVFAFLLGLGDGIEESEGQGGGVSSTVKLRERSFIACRGGGDRVDNGVAGEGNC